MVEHGAVQVRPAIADVAPRRGVERGEDGVGDDVGGIGRRVEQLGKRRITVAPLPGLPVVKDLIVDMDGFFESYKSVQPFLQNDRPAPHSLIQASGWSLSMPLSASSPPSGITTGVCGFGQPARR